MSMLCLECAVSRLKYIPLRARTQFFEHFWFKVLPVVVEHTPELW